MLPWLPLPRLPPTDSHYLPLLLLLLLLLLQASAALLLLRRRVRPQCSEWPTRWRASSAMGSWQPAQQPLPSGKHWVSGTQLLVGPCVAVVTPLLGAVHTYLSLTLLRRGPPIPSPPMNNIAPGASVDTHASLPPALC